MMIDSKFSFHVAGVLLAMSFLPLAAATLPDPDGLPAEMTKPVRVYLMMGQSNMIGYGTVFGGVSGQVDVGSEGDLDYAISTKGKYPYLVDELGAWTERMDVRYVRVQGSGGGSRTLYNNEWLKVSDGKRIGVEYGVGHHLGQAIDAPVMLLKSCIGNRGLGWDLLPPGGVSYEHTENGTTWVYPGFGGTPMRWEAGTVPTPVNWTAGVQYTGDVNRAKERLADLGTNYPGATRYVVAGFFWWQGNRDLNDEGHAIRYEQNLVRLIEQLRLEFNAPNAKFVCATLGETQAGTGGNQGMVFDAQNAITNALNYPQFDGDVATVYSYPLSMGGSSGGHYGGHAETYMNVGEAMGQAMVDLIAADEANLSNWLDAYPLTDRRFDGDDDNDNLPNAVEALLGSDPGIGNLGLIVAGNSEGSVTVTHSNPDADEVVTDVVGAYQWSLDLVNWYATDGVDGPGGTTVTAKGVADSPSPNVTTVTVTVLGESASALYLRLAATQG